MRPFLERALARLDHGAARSPGRRALDLGCGTGPATCFLARHGYDALGLDLSPTAIQMARKAAAERNLTARFEVQDVLAIEGEARFDLVVDSHCLHCIVSDEGRRRLYAIVQRLLTPQGAFVVETMARHAGVAFDPSFVFDDDGVLWRPFVDGDDPACATLIDGAPRLPHRRILAPEALHAELRAAGFVVEWSTTMPEEHAGGPRNFQAILRMP